MSILRVLTLPNPILKNISSHVDEVNNEIRKLMDDMLETMYSQKGVGLAAIQVGVAKRILVIDLREEEVDIKGFAFPLYMVNPVIEQHSLNIEEDKEGCLSIPGQMIMVKRYSSIIVNYLDYKGNKKSLKANGWVARVIQHEMEHLEGKLLIDHVSKIKRDIIVNKLKKQQKILN